MKVLEYKKLTDPKKLQCEGKTIYSMNNTTCKFTALYHIGDKKLCTVHAKIEALNLIVNEEEDLHEDFLK